jgi:hypothetical protein
VIARGGVDDADMSALRVKLLSDAFSDAARAAGDHNYLVLKMAFIDKSVGIAENNTVLAAIIFGFLRI